MRNRHDFVQHALACHPHEACGFVVDDLFVPVPNLSEQPETAFQISVEDLEAHLDVAEAIVHTHTQASMVICLDPRTPSKEDQEAQIATRIPFHICYCDGENVSDPVTLGARVRPPLVGREFIFNAQDCLTLAADYYATRGIQLPAIARDWDWFDRGEDLIDKHYRDWGFADVDMAEAREGDTFLFAVRGGVINHMGIYLGGDQLLHHLVHHLSRVDELSRWTPFVAKVIRHKDLA